MLVSGDADFKAGMAAVVFARRVGFLGVEGMESRHTRRTEPNKLSLGP